MTDLIDKNKLIKAIVNSKCTIETYNYVISGTEAYHNGLAQRQLEILDIIREQPTVDTERHAHWNDDFSFKSNAKRVDICSCCKSAIYSDIDSDKYNYCPNCGCRMDEVTNNDG